MRVLTQRELNRATLARQLLIEPARATVPKAIERLAGLQAEDTESPFVALFVRLRGFDHAHLEHALASRTVVRTPAMRSTLHLLSAEDHLASAVALKAAHRKAFATYFRPGEHSPDVDAIVARARELVAREPRTFASLAEVAPDVDPRVVRWIVRTHVPLAQVPPSGGLWRHRPAPSYMLADTWLRAAPAHAGGAERLVLRYLAAFGPASRADVAAWSGLPAVRDTLDAIAQKLRTFTDERGRTLYDVPRAPLPPPDTVVPPRLTARADNLILSHHDRTRVLPKEYAAPVIRMGRMKATFLIDGLVAGTWTVKRAKRTAEIVLEAFDGVPRREQRALREEAERVLRFVATDAASHEVRM